jgi:hypothetical protein
MNPVCLLKKQWIINAVEKYKDWKSIKDLLHLDKEQLDNGSE